MNSTNKLFVFTISPSVCFGNKSLEQLSVQLHRLTDAKILAHFYYNREMIIRKIITKPLSLCCQWCSFPATDEENFSSTTREATRLMMLVRYVYPLTLFSNLSRTFASLYWVLTRISLSYSDVTNHYVILRCT